MAISGCAPKLSRFEYTELIMGVEAKVTLYAPGEKDAREAARAAFDRMNELDGVLSDYRDDSEAMRLCETHDVPVPVSDDLFDTLERSIDLSRKTEGLFDVTIGPLVQLWRKARKSQVMPDDDALANARNRVGWNLIELDLEAKAVTLRAEGMRLDFGGIGKGYAAQEAVDAMRELSVDRCLVDLGGDIVAGEPPPDVANWRVQVRTEVEESEALVLPLRHAAVATSGYRVQFTEIERVKYSHIVDPRTGLGLTNRTAVTVVAPDGATADALASALSVLGRVGAAQLMKQFSDCSAMLEISTDDVTFRIFFNDFPSQFGDVE